MTIEEELEALEVKVKELEDRLKAIEEEKKTAEEMGQKIMEVFQRPSFADDFNAAMELLEGPLFPDFSPAG